MKLINQETDILWIDRSELAEFTDILALNSWKVFADSDTLVVSNSETHFYVSANDHDTFTLETNERNPYSKRNWEAELANSSFALRYLLVKLGPSFPGAHPWNLSRQFRLEDLPENTSIIEARPTEPEKPSRRDTLFIDGGFVGTFRRLGIKLHYAGLAACLLPLTLTEIAAIFLEGTYPENWPQEATDGAQ